MTDKPLNGTCPHPKATLKELPFPPGKFQCGLCGVTGSIMTKTDGGLLVPKIWGAQ